MHSVRDSIHNTGLCCSSRCTSVAAAVCDAAAVALLHMQRMQRMQRRPLVDNKGLGCRRCRIRRVAFEPFLDLESHELFLDLEGHLLPPPGASIFQSRCRRPPARLSCRCCVYGMGLAFDKPISRRTE